MGLRQRINEYEAAGGDKHEILDRADKYGHLNKERVKWTADDRRAMRRHPRDFTEAQLREARVWDEVKDGWLEEERKQREESSEREPEPEDYEEYDEETDEDDDEDDENE